MDRIVCVKCGTTLKDNKTAFDYMGHHFVADIPCCLTCGQVFISEEFVKGKIKEVERSLEDK